MCGSEATRLDGRVVLVPLTVGVNPFPTAGGGSVPSPAALAHQSVENAITAARTAMAALGKAHSTTAAPFPCSLVSWQMLIALWKPKVKEAEVVVKV